jgi:hypothetical protein
MGQALGAQLTVTDCTSARSGSIPPKVNILTTEGLCPVYVVEVEMPDSPHDWFTIPAKAICRATQRNEVPHLTDEVVRLYPYCRDVGNGTNLSPQVYFRAVEGDLP